MVIGIKGHHDGHMLIFIPGRRPAVIEASKQAVIYDFFCSLSVYAVVSSG